jgi:hypothetical protein
MDEPLENLYFNWLCAKVLHVVNPTPSLTYNNLFRTLHNTEFVWLLSGDDNRAEDGKELRREFLIMGDIPDHVEWRTQTPCSVFEMLIAFSKRAEFNTTGMSAKNWFWEMIANLNLQECNDANQVDPDEIRDVLTHFMWRNYTPNGDGGLFPINRPHADQTKVEIWHQFCDYLVDQDRLP